MSNQNTLLGGKRPKDLEGPDYDNIRSENLSKTITELKNEIEEYKRRERAFITHLHLKEKEIFYLEANLRQANAKLREKSNIAFSINSNNKFITNEAIETTSVQEYFVDHNMLNEFNRLKEIIKEKDEKLLQKEELATMNMSNTTNISYKRLIAKCKDYLRENNDFKNFCDNGILENFKFKNGIKETQIDHLMLKLKEKEAVINEQEVELNESAETSNLLNKRIRDLEEELSVYKTKK